MKRYMNKPSHEAAVLTGDFEVMARLDSSQEEENKNPLRPLVLNVVIGDIKKKPKAVVSNRCIS